MASKLKTTGRGRHIVCRAPMREGSSGLGLTMFRRKDVVEMLCFDTVAAREEGKGGLDGCEEGIIEVRAVYFLIQCRQHSLSAV